MKLSYALVAALGIALAAPSLSIAQTAPPPAAKAKAKAKAKTKAPPKNAASAVVSNSRSAAVTGLQITNSAGKVMAGIKQPLEPGKKITLNLPKKAGCLFTVNASFADDSEFDPSEVDLCVDKNVRFTD